MKRDVEDEAMRRKLRDDGAMRIFQEKSMALVKEHSALKIDKEHEANQLEKAKSRLDYLEGAHETLANDNEKVTNEFLRLWSCVAQDESVYVQRNNLASEVKQKTTSLSRKDDKIQSLTNVVAALKKKIDAEREAVGKWKKAMLEQEKLKLGHEKYIKELEEELRLFRHVQEIEEKKQAKQQQKQREHENNLRVARLREAKWHREVDAARTAATLSGEEYVTPEKPDSFYPLERLDKKEAKRRQSRISKDSKSHQSYSHQSYSHQSYQGSEEGESAFAFTVEDEESLQQEEEEFVEVPEIPEEMSNSNDDEVSTSPYIQKEVEKLMELQGEMEELKRISERRTELRHIAETCAELNAEEQYAMVMKNLETKQVKKGDLLGSHDMKMRQPHGRGESLQAKLDNDEAARREARRQKRIEKEARINATMKEAYDRVGIEGKIHVIQKDDTPCNSHLGQRRFHENPHLI